MKIGSFRFTNEYCGMGVLASCLLIQFLVYSMASPSFAPPANVVVTPYLETDDPQTIGVQGNWLKKRNWLIKAHEVDEEIYGVITQIEALRKSYVKLNNEIDVEFDEYYKQLGLGQGKIQELIESILVYLEQKKTQELAALNVRGKEGQDQLKIYQIEQTVKKTKNELDQLRLDMQSIDDLQRSLAERLKRFDEQVSLMQEESNKAQSRINQLWSIIDHNKAREYYYEIKNGAYERVKSSSNYLQEDLFKDFQSVVDTIRKQIAATRERIKKLEKEDDIWIVDRVRRVEEARSREATEALKKGTAAKTSAVTAVQESKQRVWYTPLVDFGSRVLEKVMGAWDWLKSKVWKAPVDQKPAAPKESEASQPTAPALPSPQPTSPSPQIPEQKALPEPAPQAR